jgi:hypothetical protein
MTPQELIELASGLTDKLFDANGEMRPVYMVETDDALNLVPPPPHLNKDAGLRLIKLLMKEMGATAYVFVDEAWVVEGADNIDLSIPAAEHPRRKEQIIFIAETDTETALGHRDIIRPVIGGKPTLGPLKIEELTQLTGRMTGLLSHQPKTRH